jgi:hypothetical protein
MAMAYLEEGKQPPEDKWPNRSVITQTFIVDKTNVDTTGPFGEPLRTDPDQPVEAEPLPY